MTRSLVLRVSIGFLITATVGAFYLELSRRSDLYWYDVRDDYQYMFTKEAARQLSIPVTSQGATIPTLEDDWDTAVLQVNVNATIAGSWFEPTIEIISGDKSWAQTFERGAKGRRYLVLDPEVVGSGSSLRFSGRHIRWEEGTAELFLFSTPEVKDATLLVLAPHPDDAEIAAFGLYSGKEAYVTTISAGNYVDGLYAHLATDPADQEHLRGRVRSWDSLVVPTWGGVELERTVNLGYYNGSLQGLHDQRERAPKQSDLPLQDPNRYRSGAVAQLLDGRRADATWRSLVQDLQAIVRAVDPGVIATPYPALDAAADHQYTTLALLEALEAVGDNDTVLLLYTNHHVLSEYYPFGPSGSAVTLPPWFDATTEFSGVYSHSLSKRDQMDKLFALEAMHDLRAAPRVLQGGPFARFLTLVSAAFDGLRRNPLGTYSYIRRAVRSNEAFFVVRAHDRHRLMAELPARQAGSGQPGAGCRYRALLLPHSFCAGPGISGFPAPNLTFICERPTT